MLKYDFQLKLAQETKILGNYTARSEHEFQQQYSFQQEGGSFENYDENASLKSISKQR